MHGRRGMQVRGRPCDAWARKRLHARPKGQPPIPVLGLARSTHASESSPAKVALVATRRVRGERGDQAHALEAREHGKPDARSAGEGNRHEHRDDRQQEEERRRCAHCELVLHPCCTKKNGPGVNCPDDESESARERGPVRFRSQGGCTTADTEACPRRHAADCHMHPSW